MEMIFIYILIIFAFLSSCRSLIGPSIWDRLLGLNLLSSKTIMIMLILSFYKDINYLLDISLTLVIVGFIGIVFISIFIEGRGKKND